MIFQKPTIRLGPKFLVQRLDETLEELSEKLDMRRFYHPDGFSEDHPYVLIILSQPSAPSLYIMVAEDQRFMVGVATTLRAEKPRSLKAAKPPAFFSEVYRRIFKGVMKSEKSAQGEIKMLVGGIGEPFFLPSIAVIGEESWMRKILMKESMSKEETVTIASFLSEESGRFILNHYNRWVNTDYRLDFLGERVAFSIAIPQGWASREKIGIYREVSESLARILSQWYPSIAADPPMRISTPDQIQIMATLWISLRRFPRWMPKLASFHRTFTKTVQHTLERFQVEFKDQWDFPDS